MFHCFINFKNTSPDGSTTICDQFHISARTEQDIRNMERVISELLDRLNVEHSAGFMFEPAIFYPEGMEDEDVLVRQSAEAAEDED